MEKHTGAGWRELRKLVNVISCSIVMEEKITCHLPSFGLPLNSPEFESDSSSSDWEESSLYSYPGRRIGRLIFSGDGFFFAGF